MNWTSFFVNMTKSASGKINMLLQYKSIYVYDTVCILTRRVPLLGQELVTLPEYLSSPVFSGVWVIRTSFMCVFCRSLFVLFLLVIVFVLPFTDSGYPFGIFKVFLLKCGKHVVWVSILPLFLRFTSCILELFWRRGFSCIVYATATKSRGHINLPLFVRI